MNKGRCEPGHSDEDIATGHYMVVAYRVEPEVPVSQSEIINWILLDTKPELSVLSASKSSPRLPRELSYDGRADNSR
jgi:hypothetical protein